MSLSGTVRIGGQGVLLATVLARVSDASLTISYQGAADTQTFEARGCDFATLEAALADDDTVADHRVVVDMGSTRVYRVRPALDRPLLSEVAVGLDGQLLETRRAGDCWEVHLRLPDRAALAELKAWADDHDLQLQVLRLSTGVDPGGDGGALTPAQREVLVTAHEMGYLEEPRNCSLNDVAAELGISSTAASGRLRRAMARIVEAHVLERPPEA